MVYDRRGAGPAVVLLHGWSLSGRMWMYEEAALGGRYDVITPDLPGLGRSDGMAGPHGVASHAAALLALLAEAEAQDVALVGFAYGGAVALLAARRDASRIAGIVTIGIPRSGGLPVDRMLKSMHRDWPAYARRSAEALCPGQSEATIRWLETMFVANRLPVAAETWADISQFEPLSVVGEIDLPILFVHGADDTFTPAVVSRECSEAAPRGRLAVVEDTGHLVPIERREWLHLTLTDFLEEILWQTR